MAPVCVYCAVGGHFSVPLVCILFCAPGDRLAAVLPAAFGNASDSEYIVAQGTASTARKAAPVEAAGEGTGGWNAAAEAAAPAGGS